MRSINEQIIGWNDLVFDVGGNLGNKAAEYSRDGARVILFEPQPKCVDFCRDRFKNNTKVIIEQIGLDSYKGEGEINMSTSHTLSSMSKTFIDAVSKERFTFPEHSWKDLMPIKVDTLDNMIEKYGKPHYIKIDVEGYELHVLKGLTQPIDYISIEFTPELKDQAFACIDYLGDNKVYNYGAGENQFFEFHSWVDKPTLIEYLNGINNFKEDFGDIYIKSK